MIDGVVGVIIWTEDLTVSTTAPAISIPIAVPLSDIAELMPYGSA